MWERLPPKYIEVKQKDRPWPDTPAGSRASRRRVKAAPVEEYDGRARCAHGLARLEDVHLEAAARGLLVDT